MKHAFLFKLLFLMNIVFSPVFSQTGPFTVKLRLGPVDTTSYPDPSHPSEWLVWVYVDIFDANKNYVSPSANYFYRWFQDDCYGVPGYAEVFAGYGHSEEDFDGNLVAEGDFTAAVVDRTDGKASQGEQAVKSRQAT